MSIAGHAGAVAVAIEVPHGPVVDTLLPLTGRERAALRLRIAAG